MVRYEPAAAIEDQFKTVPKEEWSDVLTRLRKHSDQPSLAVI